MDEKRSDEPLESAEKYSDEELLKEFKAFKGMTISLPILGPKLNEIYNHLETDSGREGER